MLSSLRSSSIGYITQVLWASFNAITAPCPAVPVVVSWFISPLLSGLAASLLFLLVRTAILRRENSLQLAFWVSRQ